MFFRRRRQQAETEAQLAARWHNDMMLRVQALEAGQRLIFEALAHYPSAALINKETIMADNVAQILDQSRQLLAKVQSLQQADAALTTYVTGLKSQLADVQAQLAAKADSSNDAELQEISANLGAAIGAIDPIAASDAVLAGTAADPNNPNPAPQPADPGPAPAPAPAPALPAITSIVPPSGVVGDLVDIHGDNLDGFTAIHFGDAAAAGPDGAVPAAVNGVISGIVVPDVAPGGVGVTVATAAGTSVAADFTVNAPPVVTGLPDNGSAQGTTGGGSSVDQTAAAADPNAAGAGVPNPNSGQ